MRSCVQALPGGHEYVQLHPERQVAGVACSAVGVGERGIGLYFGGHGGRGSVRSGKKVEETALAYAVEWLSAKFKILDWNRKVAAVFGKLRADLESRGAVLSSLDLLIAAHAIASGAVLVSQDGAFKQLTGKFELENRATHT